MNWEIKEDGTYVVGTEVMSKDEFHERFTVCSECRDCVPVNDVYWKDDAPFCVECFDDLFHSCDHCGQIYRTEDLQTPDDRTDLGLCPDCMLDSCYMCEDCGRYFYYSDNGDVGDDGEWYCNECIDSHKSQHIDSYHTYKNEHEYQFYGEEKRSECPYLGFELEVDDGENPNSAIEQIENVSPYLFHYEEDGSLSGDGFEIISPPASFNYWMEFVENSFPSISKSLVRYGYRSHDPRTCGLHVHIDKAFFGNQLDSSEAKLVYLFERHWDNMVRFSRRSPHQLHWADKYCRTAGEIIKTAKDNKDNLSRYQAVNLTNDNTIEIRLWRGTLNPKTFKATLKFTARLAEIVKTTPSAKLVKMKFEDLLGEDSAILEYWDSVKTRQIERQNAA